MNVNTTLAGHYTTTEGIAGIVAEQRIRATNIKFLNDQQEFQHAINLIGDLIRAGKPPTAGHAAKFQEFKVDIESRLASFDLIWAQGVFTASFSRETDLLSQWRGYCPKNNGYCLVYEMDDVLKAVRTQFEEAHLFEFVYDAATKAQTLKDRLNHYWKEYSALTGPKAKRECLTNFATELRLLASYFKAPAFAEERELRLVVLFESAEKVNFRTSTHCLVPYIDLPVPRNILKHVIIGPSPYSLLAERSLEAFMERWLELPTFLQDIKVTRSEIPYRAL